MGEGHLADDTTLDNKVALKFLPEAFTIDTERMARFECEAKLLQKFPTQSGNYGMIFLIRNAFYQDNCLFITLYRVPLATVKQILRHKDLLSVWWDRDATIILFTLSINRSQYGETEAFLDHRTLEDQTFAGDINLVVRLYKISGQRLWTRRWKLFTTTRDSCLKLIQVIMFMWSAELIRQGFSAFRRKARQMCFEMIQSSHRSGNNEINFAANEIPFPT